MPLKVMQVFITLKSFNPELQLKDNESAIKNKLIDLLSELKGFKFMTAKIQNNKKTLYSTFYSNFKAETIINESDIDDAFELIYCNIISNMQKSLGQG